MIQLTSNIWLRKVDDYDYIIRDPIKRFRCIKIINYYIFDISKHYQVFPRIKYQKNLKDAFLERKKRFAA